MNELLPISAAMQTDRGQVRDHNEDYVARWEPVDLEEEKKHGWLYIVADGVGGADAGEVASRFACERVLVHFLNDNLDENLGQRLFEAMQAANTDLRQLVVDRNDNKRMATTMVAASIENDYAYVANVGDSRAYHWQSGQLTQITKDQSLVAKLVEEGAITEAEAAIHPHRNVILYSIGSEKRPQIDLYELALQPGEKLILCSDGLTRHVSDFEISEFVGQYDSNTAVSKLVNTANQRGGQDNITVAIIDYDVTEENVDVDTPTVPMETVVAAAIVAEPEPELAEEAGQIQKVETDGPAKFLWPYTLFLSIVETILILFAWLLLRVK